MAVRPAGRGGHAYDSLILRAYRGHGLSTCGVLMRYYNAVESLVTIDSEDNLTDCGVIATHAAMSLVELINKVSRRYDLSKWELTEQGLEFSSPSIENPKLTEQLSLSFNVVDTEALPIEWLRVLLKGS